MSKYLSFDIGIKNLAYCLLEVDDSTEYRNIKILEWGVIDLAQGQKVKELDLMTIHSRMIDALNNCDFLNSNSDINTAILENQPCLMNPTMKSVQILLFASLWMRKEDGVIDIGKMAMFSARNKLEAYDGPEIDFSHIKTKYTRTKKLSIAYTKYMLVESEQSQEMKELFENSKKKDDLADAYLQGLTYIKKKVKM
jgi:hypothetical protein